MKTIMCYGDSNTWGYMPKPEMPASEAVNRFEWGVRWTSLLQMKLGEGWRVVEEGLNGRTTMFDCPMADRRNGLKEIDVSLLTHTPIDLVIVMLGTNDTKGIFNAGEKIIAHGIERLIERIRYGGHGPEGQSPEILIVAPPRLREGVEKGWLATEFSEASVALDGRLAGAYEQVCAACHTHFLNAGAYITADAADCIHMNEEGHAKLAELLCDEVRRILG